MVKRTRLLERALCGALLFGMSGFRCHTTQPPPDQIVLGYTSGNNIKIAWTPEASNLSWQSGNFPSNITQAAGSESGVGLMTDEHGVMHIAIAKASNNEIQLVWGAGPAIWDNSGRSLPAAPPETSPVGVILDYPNYAVAYRRSGGTVAIMLYDASARQFLADLAPLGTLNSNVIGRPDMVRRGNTIVVAWRRGPSPPHDLVASVGNVTGQTVTFSSPQVIPTPATGDFAAGVRSDPALAGTNAQFVMAVVRARGQVAGGQVNLSGWNTRLFRSTDGVNWTASADAPVLTITDRTYLGLAGLPSGGLVAAAIEENFPNGPHTATAARFNGTAWQSLTSGEVSSMFASQPSFKPFALIGVNR